MKKEFLLFSMFNLGKKIVIAGVTASGKSTFARKLGDKTKLPVVFVDSIMWKPRWEYVGDAEVAERLDDVTTEVEWILEGYIVKEARSFVFERADTIIYLDYSPWVASWRYVKRWWKHRKDPRPELEGSPEKFSFKFLELIWTKGETTYLNEYLSIIKPQSKIIKLASLKQAKSFLQQI